MAAYRTTTILLAALVAAAGDAPAAPSTPAPPPAVTPEVPCWLPQYELFARIDPEARSVKLRQQTTFVNRHKRPANELVFNVYPRYQVPAAEVPLLAKTLELLRMDPRDGMDRTDPCGKVCRVSWLGQGRHAPSRPPLARGPGCPVTRCKFAPAEQLPTVGQELAFYYRADLVTAMTVALPCPVAEGEAVTVEIEYELRLPEKQGRWGRWKGVTFLANWHPVLAPFDEDGWHPVPFIAWHQPFYNEAGVFRAHLTLPTREKLACTAPVASSRDAGHGWKLVDTEPTAARDFAVLCSELYEEHHAACALPDGRTVAVNCLALPQHAHYGRRSADIAAEAIAAYSRRLGPYPYRQFTVAEAYFGWNGNECGGLVMIDERVFGMPHLAAGYVEYLVAHEVCHQWWYNVVGTNGFAEPFMDEGIATHLAYRFLDGKHGKNNEMLKWPAGLEWLPSIRRDSYRYAGFYGAVGRNEVPPTVRPLSESGNLVSLFGSAYDRGGKVIGIIEDRLGEAAFHDFLRTVYRKYSFRILRVADFQRELEEYTGKPWGEFFRDWVHSANMADWAVQKADVEPCAGGYRASVVLKQHHKNHERTSVGFAFDGTEDFTVRVPVVPAAGVIELTDPPGRAQTQPDGSVRVDVTLPQRPTQIKVDPDGVLIDPEPANNFWKPPVRFRATWAYTILDEADITTAHDRWNVTAGPWLYGSSTLDPWYIRSSLAGVRLGASRTQQFAGGVFAAYRSNIRDVVVGADALFDHCPYPRAQLGFNFERRIAEPFGSPAPTDVTRAAAFARHVFQYSSSMYLTPMNYAEAYVAYQDNFLPFARQTVPGAVRYDRQTLGGVHYRLDYRTPYWDPGMGVYVDVGYGGGVADLDRREATHQFSGELAGYWQPPDGLGYLSEVKFAARGHFAAATPRRGLFYALGGGNQFRGYDLAERQGSRVAVGNFEARFPIFRRAEFDALDHIITLRGVQLAAFYDVGAIHANGQQVGNVAHAVGAGLRIDVAWFSFIERSVLRFDVAKTVSDSTPVQFWFGLQHPF